MSQLHDAGRARDERLDARERLDVLLGDLVYAFRTLVRQRGFASVVILTFALGIGANATMFGVVDRLLLRPPPQVGDPATLLQVSRPIDENGQHYHNTAMQYPLYAALRADSAAFREVAALTFTTTQSIGTGVNAEQAQVVLTSSNYFRVLETEPALGRFFGPAEDGDNASSPAVIISYNFWQRRFAGDRAVLGKTIRIGPQDFTVIGATRPGFTGTDPTNVDAWVPLSYAQALGMVREGWTSNWGMLWIVTDIRLQRGIAPEAATARAFRWFTDGFTAWSAQNRKGRGFPWEEKAPFELRSILPSTQRADDPRGEARAAARGRHRRRAVDCLRERRKLAARARHGATTRDRRPFGVRRVARAPPATPVRRDGVAGGVWRRGGAAGGALGNRAAASHVAQRLRLDGIGVRRSRGCDDRRTRRADRGDRRNRTCAARESPRCRRVAQVRWARGRRWRLASQSGIDDRAGDAVGDPDRRRGAVRPEPAQGGGGSARLPDDWRARRVDGCRPVRLQAAAAGRSLCEPARSHCRAPGRGRHGRREHLSDAGDALWHPHPRAWTRFAAAKPGWDADRLQCGDGRVFLHVRHPDSRRQGDRGGRRRGVRLASPS